MNSLLARVKIQRSRDHHFSNQTIAERGVEQVFTDIYYHALMVKFYPEDRHLDEYETCRAAYRQLVKTAVQIEQYRAIHQRLPGELDELLPDLLPELPRDPFTGDVLFYRPQDAGYILYSTGPNLTDNGGTAWDTENYDSILKSDLVIEISR